MRVVKHSAIPDQVTWNNRDASRWHVLIEHLRDVLPADKAVRVTRSARLVSYGDTDDRGTHYLVRVSRRLGFSEAVYALEEEWAHCLAGWVGNEIADHGLQWGMALSTVRREILQHQVEEGW